MRTRAVCIIEAMKVFNEIPAEIRGTIVAMLVEDGEAVDFDKPLFKVDHRQVVQIALQRDSRISPTAFELHV